MTHIRPSAPASLPPHPDWFIRQDPDASCRATLHAAENLVALCDRWPGEAGEHSCVWNDWRARIMAISAEIRAAVGEAS